MRLSLLGLAAAAVIAFAGTAIAADIHMPVKAAPPPAPAFSWTGCSVNAGIGYSMYDIDHSTTNAAGLILDTGHDNAGRGWLGRFGAGCDYQFASSFVIGAFADYDWANIHGGYSYNCPSGCSGPTGFGGDLKESSAWSAGARLGFVVAPQLLSFVDGGYRQARFNSATLVDLSGATLTSVSLPSQTRGGWFIGGGAEYALGWWKNVFWRTEYRFAQYNSQTVSTICITGTCGGAGAVHAIDTSKAYEQTVTSSLVWRF
jgi:outer membrane immunogenic protein